MASVAHCASCAEVLRVGARFCEACGTEVSRQCPACGFDLASSARFCAQCGRAVADEHAPLPAAAVPDSSAGWSTSAVERRQITVLFCDLVGSTGLSRRLDPEELREIIRDYQALAAEAVERFEGYVAQYLGDGVLVYFGYPRAHEDDAERAVRAGLEVAAGMDVIDQRWRERAATPLAVRIGIHTGLVLIDDLGGGARTERLALGDTPNLAARLQGLGPPGGVMVSAATFNLVAGRFDSEDLGVQGVKGVAEPLPVWRILASRTSASRFDAVSGARLTPLVGRAHELGLLLERWQLAQDGDGQVVMVSGEPGLGKSRLLHELRASLADARLTALRFQCSPFRVGSAWHPLIEYLERALGWSKDATAKDRLAALEALVVGRYGLTPMHVQLLAALLALPVDERYTPLNTTPRRQKEDALAAAVALTLAAADGGALLLFEDAHWADPSTLEFLAQLVARTAGARLLAVITHRPEFTAPWTIQGHVTAVALARLSRTQSGGIVAKVTAGKSLPQGLVEQIVQKTDGVPLFIEELTRAILESGRLREGDHGFELVPGSAALDIPATIRDSLTARLEHNPRVKTIAQLAAAIGREFDPGLLAEITGLDRAALDGDLDALVRSGLAFCSGAPPDAHYIFKHALVQDAAYESMPRAQRQTVHAAIANALERTQPELYTNAPETIALHLTAAGDHAQAVPLWQIAGQLAIQRLANQEAVSYLARALELLDTLPATPARAQRELELQLTIAAPLIASNGYAAPAVGTAYERAFALCEEISDRDKLFTAMRGLWVVHTLRCELVTARALGEQLLVIAREREDPALLLEAHHALGQTLFHCGEFGPAVEHCLQGCELYRPAEHQAHVHLYGTDPGISCHFFGGLSLWFLGFADQALQWVERGFAFALDSGHPLALAYGHQGLASVRQFRGDVTAADAAESTIALSDAQGLPFWKAFGTFVSGWALAASGRAAEGIATMREGMSGWEATGAKVWQPYFRAPIVEACLRDGQLDAGMAMLEEAWRAAQTLGEGTHLAELYRLRGELALARAVESSPMDHAHEPSIADQRAAESGAEGDFVEALAIARQQEARALELRAAMSLARLWLRQGRGDDARELLGDIYGWFTEGFATSDLVAARTLLESDGVG